MLFLTGPPAKAFDKKSSCRSKGSGSFLTVDIGARIFVLVGTLKETFLVAECLGLEGRPTNRYHCVRPTLRSSLPALEGRLAKIKMC